MFRIKICGVTRVQDAVACADGGADAIGLNFYPRSPRCVSVQAAREIAVSLPSNTTKVGVFVNASPHVLIDTYERAGLDVIQLHGDETPELIVRLGHRPVIKAFRCRASDADQVAKYLQACRERAVDLSGVLLDAYAADSYGGTGIALDWDFVAEIRSQSAGVPLLLAGGLNPENVGQAIGIARPAGVDTASGVESSPGIKDPDLVRAFIERAAAAFAQLA